MAYVVINAITVPRDKRDDIEQRFAARAGEVSKAEGFQAFEFLRPANDNAGDRYFVYTRWSSREAFEAWTSSSAFTRGHRQHGEGGPVATSSEMLAYEVVQQEESKGE